jgi:hypothetical protein
MKISVTMCEAFPSSLLPEQLEAVHGGSKDNCVDADGVVPESYGVYGEGWQGYADTISTNPCQRSIRYDTAEMAGAGPNDWARLRAHERAHTRGWDHGAGTPGTNPAYWRGVRITGR